MHVLARPAFRERHRNPYTWLLYKHMQNLGVVVEEDRPFQFFKQRYQVWHLHWPDNPLSKKNRIEASFRILVLLLQIHWAKMQKTKIIWTIHNLAAHDRLYPRLEEFFWKSFIPQLDGCIALSQSSQEAAYQRFPALANLDGFVIPHGHYRGEYPDHLSNQEARRVLGIPDHIKVMLFFGQMRPYKNLEKLMGAFEQLQDENLRLYIVGRPYPQSYLEILKTKATVDRRIHLLPEFIPTEQVQAYLRSADLVLLPYREILNSGSALLALSFDRPILVPHRGSLGELQAQVGEQWVKTYDGEVSPTILSQGLEWALNTSRPSRSPLEALDWKNLSQQTVNAYQSLLKA